MSKSQISIVGNKDKKKESSIKKNDSRDIFKDAYDTSSLAKLPDKDLVVIHHEDDIEGERQKEDLLKTKSCQKFATYIKVLNRFFENQNQTMATPQMLIKSQVHIVY